MFVTVKYGEEQSKIFNINCRNQILLHHIKKRCAMERDEVIELSDETGSVKNLRQNLDDYGSDYLKERETLILLRVETCIGDGDESEVSEKTVFTPMLSNMTENTEFIAKLNGEEAPRKPKRTHMLNPKDHMGSKHSLLDDSKTSGRMSKLKNQTKKDKKPKPPKK